MALRTSEEVQNALQTFSAAQAEFHPVRKATIATLCSNYLTQYQEHQDAGEDHAPLTQDFVQQMTPVLGTNWTQYCLDQNPGGGAGLTACLIANGEN